MVEKLVGCIGDASTVWILRLATPPQQANALAGDPGDARSE